jgi:hypothetical protein
MPDGRDKYREVRTARQFEDQINTEKCMATCAFIDTNPTDNHNLRLTLIRPESVASRSF